MNISWHPIERVFLAEFSQDFAGDLDAVKAAGFRPLGVPPPWIWHAPNIKALNKLRLNRPASGLTITTEALEVYKPLAEAEAKNDAVKQQLAEEKKKLKKKLKADLQEQEPTDSIMKMCELGFMCISREDLPPAPPFVPSYITSKIKPIGVCRVCNDPTYGWPDLGDICLWCEGQLVENNA